MIYDVRLNSPPRLMIPVCHSSYLKVQEECKPTRRWEYGSHVHADKWRFTKVVNLISRRKGRAPQREAFISGERRFHRESRFRDGALGEERAGAPRVVNTTHGAAPPIARVGTMATRLGFARIARHTAGPARRRSAVQRDGRAPLARSALRDSTQYSAPRESCWLPARSLSPSLSRVAARISETTEAPPIPRTTPEPDGARGASRPWRNFIPFASRVALPRPTTSAEVSTRVCVYAGDEDSNWPDRRAPLRAKSRGGLRSLSRARRSTEPRAGQIGAYAFLSDAEAVGAADRNWNGEPVRA